MRKLLLTTLVALFALPAMAQQGLDRSKMKAMDDQKNYIIEKGIERYLIMVDYDSWFEKLTATATSGGQQESQALYYGFGLSVEKNWYQPTWGWGIGGGVLGGSALGGDKSASLAYFQNRVPWWGARVTPRIFYRWTPRTDFGLDFMAFYKNVSWPTTDAGVTASTGSQIITGAFVDMRVRFNAKLEMLQSFGMIYKDESIYWRLGLAYRL